ncbi:MAG: LysR family transcriptional regulator [Sporomusaceae bacterium]|nr:LysR family transcriptional regulator [Sporomusaceae bacterium]
MDLIHLIYFVEVARKKSFTQAAKSLHVSQPAISKVIKTLEGELDTTLLERTGREILLTDTGEAIFERAQSILAEMTNLRSELADITGLKRGKLTFGLPPMIGARFFPQIISRFKQSYSEIDIQIMEAGSKEVESAIQSGLVELGVVALPLQGLHFEIFSLLDEPLRVVLPPSHELAQNSEIPLAALHQESFILYRDDFSLNDLILQECHKAGFEPKIALQSSQWDFIAEMVSANLGIALLPHTICQELDPKRFAIARLGQTVIPWHLAMIWKQGKYLSFAARQWLTVTKNYFANDLKKQTPLQY